VSKYATLESDVFSVFGGAPWKAEKINTYPSNFVPDDAGAEFIRVSIVPSGAGLNLRSASGLMIVDIFTEAGMGPSRASLIADKLDQFLVGKSLSTQPGRVTQFGNSALGHSGADRDNPALHRSRYSVQFNHYGAS
jgi:hypothetical protein